ncbi:tRNA uridine-5-carboxymethylaminomethyl(34) synthesis enzyme MnmG [Lentisphaera profundi]|uniref:tRNA uridine 5-carboxymethylaminomethyl modification enzyme MnmG n=1 Tax=Lentisphaera profundi TaxID=1658616 RepID=A0ABY7VYH2_9BACT|nr:tRNA uridine-5-carboxymethylaminomethyl(34) synthesis enzyme MnmG [Lentisphaera profundi]WDE98324.1 tRNA uridine-5-carboxymethylaminomethyl(34) synthesis enzyme MnmG [Lentisphaera profundi]
MKNYDVIIIGGGHAGIEASLASARMGAETLLITQNLDHIGQMSCNPAIGGIAKGHVVREIDAMGGEMGQNTDASALQFKMLNSSRGPAVWSPRAQCDKVLYQRRMKQQLEKTPKLHTHQAEGLSFVTEKGKVIAVQTQFGDKFEAKAFVLCCGTFMRGLMHFGPQQLPGGRTGDTAADAISDSLKNDLGLELMRLKTGTPPRVLAKTIDFDQLERQDGESGKFSYWTRDKAYETIDRGGIPQMPCYIGRTSAETKRVITENLHLSPMYNGSIDAIGTRYCPSIEDKIHRFADKDSHQIFLEPEGVFTEEYYLNGISTSLPVHVQNQIVHSIPGLENAEIARYAYAVEYDVVSPHQTLNSLALKPWPNLFVAGQINGTSGYEEAAGQGLIAGANAAGLVAGKPPLVLERDQAYIGVMIDDLVTKDISEPYRLFTSRAEYRLLLRQDNADRRLSKIAYDYGLLPYEKYKIIEEKETLINNEIERLKNERSHGKSLWEHLSSHKNTYDSVVGESDFSEEIKEQIQIDARYECYIQREKQQVERQKRLAKNPIPEEIDYLNMTGLSNEARNKLSRYRPVDLGQAARIDGVTPAEIGLIQVHIKRWEESQKIKA